MDYPDPKFEAPEFKPVVNSQRKETKQIITINKYDKDGKLIETIIKNKIK